MDVITTTEAARMLRVSPETVRRLCESGTISAFKLHATGHWRVFRQRLIDSIERPHIEADDAFLQNLKEKKYGKRTASSR